MSIDDIPILRRLLIPYTPQPDAREFLDRLQRQEHDGLEVSVAVLDAATFEDPSTKKAAQALAKWGAAQPTLVILEVDETGALRSFRNIERVSVLDATAVGVADVIGAASIVVSEKALEILEGRAS